MIFAQIRGKKAWLILGGSSEPTLRQRNECIFPSASLWEVHGQDQLKIKHEMISDSNIVSWWVNQLIKTKENNERELISEVYQPYSHYNCDKTIIWQ